MTLAHALGHWVKQAWPLFSWSVQAVAHFFVYCWSLFGEVHFCLGDRMSCLGVSAWTVLFVLNGVVQVSVKGIEYKGVNVQVVWESCWSCFWWGERGCETVESKYLFLGKLVKDKKKFQINQFNFIFSLHAARFVYFLKVKITIIYKND